MKVILSGGTGFLGRPLCAQLASGGHEVVVLTRGTSARSAIGRTVTWRPDEPGVPGRGWMAEVDGADVVVNLAGDGIADKRWTARRKDVLRQSRILSTRHLVAAIRAAPRKPALFVSGSAIGYYGDTGDAPQDESFPPGSDFLATLCVDWEAEAHAVSALACRLVVIRTGLVLARDGGVLGKMIRPYRLLVGGPLGSGRQYMSWIHRDDWIGLAQWALDHPALTGAVNATAPQPVTNGEFSATLARVLKRPNVVRAPGFALRAALGEMADVALLDGQRVIPKRALESGYVFKYPELEAALRAALRQ